MYHIALTLVDGSVTYFDSEVDLNRIIEIMNK
jgi:hypothetical protein